MLARLIARLTQLKEDLKARHRGEVRVAPGMRGRVYAKMPPEILEGPYFRRFTVKPKVQLQIDVIRRNGKRERVQ